MSYSEVIVKLRFQNASKICEMWIGTLIVREKRERESERKRERERERKERIFKGKKGREDMSR